MFHVECEGDNVGACDPSSSSGSGEAANRHSIGRSVWEDSCCVSVVETNSNRFFKISIPISITNVSVFRSDSAELKVEVLESLFS